MPVKLRLEDYLLLDESGAFDAYAKTELIEGEIFFMNAQHRPHARIKTRLLVLIAEALKGMELEAIVEGSVAIPPINVPEPDIVVTSEAEGTGLIPLDSVRLIVELADANARDRLDPQGRDLCPQRHSGILGRRRKRTRDPPDVDAGGARPTGNSGR